MLNTYRYATGEELRIRELSRMTPEDQAIANRMPYRMQQFDHLDADRSRRLCSAAERWRIGVAVFVYRREARNCELYGQDASLTS